MEDILRHCIRKHGFKAVQISLTRLALEYQEFYETELKFLKCLPTAELVVPSDQAVQTSEEPPAPPPTPLQLAVEQPSVKVIQISERAAGKAEEAMDAKEFTLAPAVQESATTREFALEPPALAAPEGSKRKMKKVIHKNGRVIPVKAEPVSTDLEEEAAPVPAPAPAQPAPVNEFVEPTTQVQTITQRKTPAEIKKWQREQEAARRTYMKKNKISRSSLMTVENMRQWLTDGQTYAWIAREQLGCKEEDVSKFAKENGLQRKKN
jgi:hypothetical protein